MIPTAFSVRSALTDPKWKRYAGRAGAVVALLSVAYLLYLLMSTIQEGHMIKALVCALLSVSIAAATGAGGTYLMLSTQRLAYIN